MNNYRYNLEKGSKKHHCPGCEKKRFVRYIDIETGECLPDQYGRCDREQKCGYHLNPYVTGYGKQDQPSVTEWKPKPLAKKEIIFFPVEVLKRTRTAYEQNIFIQNLLKNVPFPFEAKDIEKVISLYHLGTIQRGNRAGAITFPFIDEKGGIRTIQVKQFDRKNNTLPKGTDFLHSIIQRHHNRNKTPLPEWLKAYNKNESKVSCLFGEHLIHRYPNNPIALVEAPKTAIYGSLYFGLPEDPKRFIWLAVYNKSSLTLNKLKPLKGRTIVLFPDLSKDGDAFLEWSDKASKIQKELSNNTVIKVSDLLEKNASQKDRDEGNDLADFLIKQDWRQYREASEPAPKQEPPRSIRQEDQDFFKDLMPVRIDQPSQEDWSDQINELEAFFLRSPQASRPQFIETHLAYVKASNGNRTYLPYLDRLQDLKNQMQNKN